MFYSIYRVYPRVILRVRAILDCIFNWFTSCSSPPASLGGTGGPVAPFRGVRGDILPESYNVMYGSPFWTLYSPLCKGGRGVPHSSLLAVTVRTDTSNVVSCLGVGQGLKGNSTVPIRCDVCGLALKRCRCRIGVDY